MSTERRSSRGTASQSGISVKTNVGVSRKSTAKGSSASATEVRVASGEMRKARALSPQFEALWDHIKDRTRFAVTVKSDNLVMKVLPEFDLLSVQPPRVTVAASDVGVVEGAFVARQTGAARTVEVLDRDGPLRTSLISSEN